MAAPVTMELWEQWHREWTACPQPYANANAIVRSTRNKMDVDGRTWVELSGTGPGRAYIYWAVNSRRNPGSKPPLNLYLASRLASHTQPGIPSSFETEGEFLQGETAGLR